MGANDRMNLALRKLARDGRSLAVLESKLQEFNVFEILRVERKELQHSNFLAHLLDPRSSGVLGRSFLRELLLHAAESADQVEAIASTYTESLRPDRWTVVREQNHNDIRIVSSDVRFVAVIENKIDAREGKGQLRQYRERVERDYPSARKMFVYLTPGKDPPKGDSPERNHWIPFGYEQMAKILSRLLRSKRAELKSSHRHVIEQYLLTLRKRILKKSDLTEKAHDFYRRHQLALDYVFENRPSWADSLHAELRKLVTKRQALRLDSESDPYFRFIPKSWDSIRQLKTARSWNDGSPITIEINTPPKNGGSKVSVYVAMQFGPAPKLARALYRAIEGKRTARASGYSRLRKRVIAAPPPEESAEFNKRVLAEVRLFIDKELPDIDETIQSAFR